MTQQITDPYAILGIPRDASEQQVRQAYRHLAMRYHPDLHPDERTSERMRRLNEAWHILASPIRRSRYDADTVKRVTSSARSGALAGPGDQRTEGRGWPRALVTVAVAWLVLGTIFFGFLPAPIIGLAVLVAARMIVRGP